MFRRNPLSVGLALGTGLLLAAGCGQSSSSGAAANGTVAVSAASALDVTVASASDSAGTLLCNPSTAQISACSGESAGDACSLTLATPPKGGSATVAGTCLTTLDGSAVACTPNPPAPPAALVNACTGDTAGASCSVTAPDGNTFTGTCMDAPGTSTLVCGRAHTPPQAAIDGCDNLTAGASCTLTSPDGKNTQSGVCSLGPASTGPLACAPPQALSPVDTQACSGLAAGATCALGPQGQGTCIVPTSGGSAVCLPACANIGGSFNCEGGGMQGGQGSGGPGAPPPSKQP